MLSAESSDITGRGAQLPCESSAPCGCPGIRGAKLQVSMRCIVAELCVFEFVATRGGGPLRP